MTADIKKIYAGATLCTLSLGLAMSLHPGAVFAASHCKGLTQDRCSSSTACKWVEARPGAMNKSPRRGYCRLDVGAAAKIAKDINEKRKSD